MKRSATLIFVLVLISQMAAAGSEPAGVPSGAKPDDLVAHSRAAYTSLKSYSDTGVVLDQFGPAPENTYRHTFKTYFRAPRNFLFEFKMDPRAGGHRIVIWCDGGDYQSWFSASDQYASYPKGSNTATLPFQQSAFHTRGAVALIPGLIYAGSGLVSAFSEFGDAERAGTEVVTGRETQKLMGVARSVYPATHRETNVRRATVWIDSQNGLLRKIYEDTPKGMPATAVIRITTTLEPQANPKLDDSVFKFTVPSQQQ
jgi:outer membrane lipoprotein-sorting protein